MDQSAFGLDPDSRALWWLINSEPGELLELVGREGSERKCWLFIAACLRRIKVQMPGSASITAIDIVEECAECRKDNAKMSSTYEAIRKEREILHDTNWNIRPSSPNLYLFRATHAAQSAALWSMCPSADRDVFSVVKGVVNSAARSLVNVSAKNSHSQLAHLVRDIFNNPFLPLRFDTSWITPTVLALARQMYDSRNFSAMPILADALQDAGCDSVEILDHCRDPNGIHARGCWVVDCLIAGKSSE